MKRFSFTLPRTLPGPTGETCWVGVGETPEEAIREGFAMTHPTFGYWIGGAGYNSYAVDASLAGIRQITDDTGRTLDGKTLYCHARGALWHLDVELLTTAVGKHRVTLSSWVTEEAR